MSRPRRVPSRLRRSPARAPRSAWHLPAWHRPRLLRDLGRATAEYAVATLAACGFAGLLLAVLRGDQVRGLLLGLVRRALAVG